MLEYVTRLLLFTLMIWVILNFSLFNADSKFDKYLQDLFNTHFGEWVYPKDRQNSVAVLLLTDEIVDGALDGQWPASYTFHASVLGDLLQHRPKAVFIDFYWMNRAKPGSDYLINILEAYRSEKTPVYLAVPSNEWFESFWPELRGLVKPVSAKIALDPMDFVSRSYPQTDKGLPSAAFTIAEDMTHVSVATSSRGEMEIFWGMAKNPKNWAWMQTDSAANDGLISIFKDGFADVGTTIPYTTTVFVRDLINPAGETEDAAQADLSNHLLDHVVIYGASISGIQDYVFLPTRSIYPGAYYHAMALDNLLTWGENYKSNTMNTAVRGFPDVPLWLMQIVFLLPLSVAFVFRATPTAECRQVNSLHRKLVHCKVCFWLLALVYVLIISWFQYAVLDLSVASWIGYVQLLGFGVLIEKLEFVERILSLIKRIISLLKITGSRGK